MLEVIKRYIRENKKFLMLLIGNFFIFFMLYSIDTEPGINGREIVCNEWIVYIYFFISSNLILLRKDNLSEYKKVIIIYSIPVLILFSIWSHFAIILSSDDKYFNLVTGLFIVPGIVIPIFCLIVYFAVHLIIYIRKLIKKLKKSGDEINKKLLILKTLPIGLIMSFLIGENIRNYNILLIVLILIFLELVFSIVLVRNNFATKKIKLKKELVSILLAILVSMFLFLIKCNNLLFLITIFIIIYLFVRDNIRLFRMGKKTIIVSILLILIFTIINLKTSKDKYQKETKINWILVDLLNDEWENGYTFKENATDKTGVCYAKYGGKILIFGKVVDGREEGKWVYWNKNGEKEGEGNYGNDREGKWKEWYVGDGTYQEGVYRNGVREGKWIRYKDGKKIGEGIFKEGKGNWIEYYENGKKKSEGICCLGNIYQADKREGNYIEWYENGQKKIEGKYVDNRNEGNWIEYYENGRKKSEVTYKYGEEIERIEWDKNKNSLKEGKYVEYYENGKKESEGNYLKGKAEGKWIEYYEDGKKYAEITYKDGKEIKRIKYDKNGNRIE